jgi:RHS repeat-associated protein
MYDCSVQHAFSTPKFTGKERDSKSGLDNFGARYGASSMGRFMSPDPFYHDSHVADPQSWNEYAYARNNPLSRTDPDGHLEEDKHGKVKFHATGTAVATWSFVDSKGNTVSISQKYQTGTVTTDDGHQVQAEKATGKMQVSISDSNGKVIGKGASGLNAELGPGWSATADCHGTTFAHGQLWINNGQVPAILGGDGYHTTTTPGVGDVGVYSRGSAVTPDSVDHSVRVSGVDAGGNVASVTSKGGITPKVETTPSGAWANQSDTVTYYTQSPQQ